MTKNNNQSPTGLEGIYQQFEKGKLDLATAFWAFGFVGAIIASIILVYLAEAISGFFWLPYFGINGFIIAALWECAENHNKFKQSKKQSTVWGVLTQIYCGLGVLGLIFTAYDLIKTL